MHVKTLRIFVEPIDVEIDEDSGILWTSLQTAFPGCSGMYYRDRNDTSTIKKSIRFDGKKFRAPGGCWNDDDREYYVTLNQRSHGNGHFSTYTDATKQFEKSVQAVQKMLVASGMKLDVEPLIKRRSSREHKSSNETVSSGHQTPIPDPIHAIKERSEILQSSERCLTPIEKQFLDLASLSNAKDDIIEKHREDEMKLKKQLEDSNRIIQELREKIRINENKLMSQEGELDIMRNLSSQFEEAKRTSDAYEFKMNELQKRVDELEIDLNKYKQENNSLFIEKEKNETEIKELFCKIECLEKSKEIISKELDQLRPFADVAGIQDLSTIPTFIDTLKLNENLETENKELKNELDNVKKSFEELLNIHTPMIKDFTSIREKNDALEQRLEHVDEEIKCLNENWARELRDKQDQWEYVKNDAEIEITSLKEQLERLQQALEESSREAARNAQRASELEHENNEYRRTIEANFKTQQVRRPSSALSSPKLGILRF